MVGAYFNYFPFRDIICDARNHTIRETTSLDAIIMFHEYYSNDAAKRCNNHLFNFIFHVRSTLAGCHCVMC